MKYIKCTYSNKDDETLNAIKMICNINITNIMLKKLNSGKTAYIHYKTDNRGFEGKAWSINVRVYSVRISSFHASSTMQINTMPKCHPGRKRTMSVNLQIGRLFLSLNIFDLENMLTMS